MTSKSGRKSWAIKVANNGDELLHYFARDKLSEQVIAYTEKFFLKCIIKHDTFSKLLFVVYHKKHL